MPKVQSFKCNKGMPAGCKDGITACCGFRADGSMMICNHLRVTIEVDQDIIPQSGTESWF